MFGIFKIEIFLNFPNSKLLETSKLNFFVFAKLLIFSISKIENFSNFSNLKFLDWFKLEN